MRSQSSLEYVAHSSAGDGFSADCRHHFPSTQPFFSQRLGIRASNLSQHALSSINIAVAHMPPDIVIAENIGHMIFIRSNEKNRPRDRHCPVYLARMDDSWNEVTNGDEVNIRCGK